MGFHSQFWRYTQKAFKAFVLERSEKARDYYEVRCVISFHSFYLFFCLTLQQTDRARVYLALPIVFP